VLIAELITGELARVAGLRLPELVFIELPAELALTEPDPEIQQLIRASAGLNLALDYLPGSVTFDPIVDEPEPLLASSIVWLDAYCSNVDRTARNANMLMWHRQLWLIDHGAALYFHHGWGGTADRSQDPFPLIRDHVLLRFASALQEADTIMVDRITPAVIRDIVEQVPEEWLSGDTSFESPRATREAYIRHLARRLQAPRPFLTEAQRARSELL
jgi:hypothetical protein